VLVFKKRTETSLFFLLSENSKNPSTRLLQVPVGRFYFMSRLVCTDENGKRICSTLNECLMNGQRCTIQQPYSNDIRTLHCGGASAGMTIMIPI
jgi:hypothetical protein